MPIYEYPIPVGGTHHYRNEVKHRRQAHTDSVDSHQESDASTDISDGHEDDDQGDDSGKEELLVPADFPAAPIRESKEQLPPKPKTQRNLKRQHFAVLTAILHKCLQEGDYARASRTFGLLLRFEINGQRANLRTRGLWGIGSEILLHRPHADQNEQEQAADEGLPFREKGLQEARAYFDRLMLEYPHRKLSARLLNEVHFFPAILGLEIVQLQAKVERAKRQAEARTTSSPEQGRSTGEGRRHEQQMQGLQNEMRSIADRLDDKLAFPPFDRNVDMLRLKGDVWSWMADVHGDRAHPEWRDIAAAAYARSRELEGHD